MQALIQRFSCLIILLALSNICLLMSNIKIKTSKDTDYKSRDNLI